MTTTILLCNLGTPEVPTPRAVRTYLAEFLSDPRVVELPKLLWWPILHGIVLRVRPRQSAAKYQSIWLPDTVEGSPLKVWTARQAQLLGQTFKQQGQPVQVRYAMRYGQPSIASQLDALKAQGMTRILVLPLYPQYSAATTASAFDAVYAWAALQRHIPEFRFVNHHHAHPGYINALAAQVRQHWQAHGQGEQLLMSFHGMPERTRLLGDPYSDQCQETAHLLAQALGLSKSQYCVSFQSRFGKAKWLQPYTEPTLVHLAQTGVRRVDVICPGFSADCLETLEEINMEARQAFMDAGGEAFHYIACLNDRPEWIEGLQAIAQQHLQGWM